MSQQVFVQEDRETVESAIGCIIGKRYAHTAHTPLVSLFLCFNHIQAKCYLCSGIEDLERGASVFHTSTMARAWSSEREMAI